MNIFLLDNNPKNCVQYYPDAHINKMILEYAQILCTVKSLWGQHNPEDIPYKPTHQNHPCVRFIAEHYDHYAWLWILAHKLSTERRYRWPSRPIHKSTLVLSHVFIRPIDSVIERILGQIRGYGFLSPLKSSPPQAMPSKYQCEDPIDAYREYFLNEKTHLFTWTGRPTPSWVLQNRSIQNEFESTTTAR